MGPQVAEVREIAIYKTPSCRPPRAPSISKIKGLWRNDWRARAPDRNKAKWRVKGYLNSLGSFSNMARRAVTGFFSESSRGHVQLEPLCVRERASQEQTVSDVELAMEPVLVVVKQPLLCKPAIMAEKPVAQEAFLNNVHYRAGFVGLYSQFKDGRNCDLRLNFTNESDTIFIHKCLADVFFTKVEADVDWDHGRQLYLDLGKFGIQYPIAVRVVEHLYTGVLKFTPAQKKDRPCRSLEVLVL
ncbi:hypothetical protein MAR_023283 [Mya arenaria]|uniref:BTB domain-containing protein n=1 Tax=Mya arenaria TaxID=6604 RepID=A0ABY7DQF6_MYAAR|nr:hypothetical protein MAR_023283 [Mya arenaria]